MMGLYLGLMLFVHVPSWSWTEPGRWAEQCTPKVCTPPSCTQQNCTRLWQPPTTYTTHCDKSGDLTPACSATRFVDEHLLGWSHMYRTGRFACERAPQPQAAGSDWLALRARAASTDARLPSRCRLRVDTQHRTGARLARPRAHSTTAPTHTPTAQISRRRGVEHSSIRKALWPPFPRCASRSLGCILASSLCTSRITRRASSTGLCCRPCSWRWDSPYSESTPVMACLFARLHVLPACLAMPRRSG
jgi:hypothetical protein